MGFRRLAVTICTASVAFVLSAAPAAAVTVERVSTAVPFPRGLVEITDADGRREIYVLARGRVRGSGGVSAAVEDRAGSIVAIDPDVTGPIDGEPSDLVRSNGRVVAEPTDPPFRLWDRTSTPPQADTRTDRPYCVLRYHEPSDSLFLCAFSGVDLPPGGASSFSKNFTDGLLRYDRRTGEWSQIERHDAGSFDYPHHDPASNPPPHGWLQGPDNCLVVGDVLYAVAKDNSRLVAYDLSAFVDDPHAPPPGGEVMFDKVLRLRPDGSATTPLDIEGASDIEGLWVERSFEGHSMLAERDGWLYVGFRTTSEIVRVRLDDGGRVIRPEDGRPVTAQLLAKFTPFDPATRQTADLTDMAFGPDGRLYVVSAEPAAVYRFRPDPAHVYDGRRDGGEPPWLDLAGTLGRQTKSENVMFDSRGRLFVTSGDGYGDQAGAEGTVYRVSGIDFE